MPNQDALARFLQMAATPKKPNPGFDPDYLADENVDPSVRADVGLGAMQGEVRNRLFQAERSMGGPDGYRSPNATSGFEVNALKNLLGGIVGERAESPLVDQQAEVDNQRKLELDSINSGFTGTQNIGRFNKALGGGYTNKSGVPNDTSTMSPVQQREIYKRNFAEKNSQSAIQGMQEEGLNFRQGRQLNAMNRQTNAQMAPSASRADLAAQMWDDIVNKRVTPDQVRAFNPTTGAVGFQSQPGLNQTTLMNNLGDAQGVMATNNPFTSWDNATPQQQNFNRRVTSYLQSTGLDANSQQSIIQVLKDPSFSALSLDDLKRNAMFMDDGVTPDPSFDERDWQKWAQAYIYLKSASGQ